MQFLNGDYSHSHPVSTGWTRGHPGILSTVSTVSLVAPFEAVTLDEQLILFSKTSLSVMFFLASNVVRNSGDIGMPDRESSVSAAQANRPLTRWF
jgi:hypothetical protein